MDRRNGEPFRTARTLRASRLLPTLALAGCLAAPVGSAGVGGGTRGQPSDAGTSSSPDADTSARTDADALAADGPGADGLASDSGVDIRDTAASDSAVDGAPGDATTTTADAANPGTGVATCKQACKAAADCVSPQAPAWLDLDNFACKAGTCAYVGCHSTDECESTIALACAEVAPGLNTCQPACTATADCAPAGSPAWADADNYACVQGVCKYTGCNADDECKAIGNYACRDAGGGVKTCVMKCSQAADCAVPNAPASVDADNFGCEGDVCKYTGCKADTECSGLGASGTAWVCKP